MFSFSSLLGMFQETFLVFPGPILLTLVFSTLFLTEFVSVGLVLSLLGVGLASSSLPELSISVVLEAALFLYIEGFVVFLTRFIYISSGGTGIADSSAICTIESG